MNYVFDWKFFQKDIYGEEDGVDEEGNTQRPDSQEMLAKVNLFNERLKKIPGVIETGILTQSDCNYGSRLQSKCYSILKLNEKFFILI